MKKILIGGCSFSQSQRETAHPRWKPWTDMMKEEYKGQLKIINSSQSSFGQSLIVKSLMEELIDRDFQVDYVFVQWSAVGRAYSNNQTDFIERMMKQGEEYFAPYEHEYRENGKGYGGWVTDMTNQMEEDYYVASIDTIILFKYLLESKNIPYTMFWGWEQITPRLYQKKKKWLDIMYDENFWRFNQNGGMLEWIVDKIGEEKGYSDPHDHHPSTQGHQLFYNEIIKDIINTKIL